MLPKPFVLSSNAKSTTYVASTPQVGITAELCEKLVTLAKADPLNRARVCLHSSPDAPVQEMVIAFTKKSKTLPHRHHNKSESYHLISGEVDVVLFDETGKETQRITLSSDSRKGNLMYRLSDPVWHTVEAKSEVVIMHETTSGPFDPAHTQWADWKNHE